MENRSGMFVKSIMAGVMISIGCVVYLSSQSKPLGAILFSVGLLSICSFGMNLYTGRVGYLGKYENFKDILLIWIGNLFGSQFASGLIMITNPSWLDKASEIAAAKLKIPLFYVLILSAFCGVLMYVAVHSYYAWNGEKTFGAIMVIFCVSVFIMSGFEHSVADMNYLVLGIRSVSQIPRAFAFLMTASVGNAIGAISTRYAMEYK